jgi:hypothetical protein
MLPIYVLLPYSLSKKKDGRKSLLKDNRNINEEIVRIQMEVRRMKRICKNCVKTVLTIFVERGIII